MEPHDFGWALRQIKEQRRVQRIGWNGKGMWIVLVEDWGVHGAADALLAGSTVIPHPFIGMKTADDTFVPWLCSQTDLLATDWQVVE